MLMLECVLKIEEGIIDEKSKIKREKRLEKECKKALDAGRAMNPLVLNYCKPSQRCCQFIRWLRICIERNTPWSEAVKLIRPLMLSYLQ